MEHKKRLLIIVICIVIVFFSSFKLSGEDKIEYVFLEIDVLSYGLSTEEDEKIIIDEIWIDPQDYKTIFRFHYRPEHPNIKINFDDNAKLEFSLRQELSNEDLKYIYLSPSGDYLEGKKRFPEDINDTISDRVTFKISPSDLGVKEDLYVTFITKKFFKGKITYLIINFQSSPQVPISHLRIQKNNHEDLIFYSDYPKIRGNCFLFEKREDTRNSWVSDNNIDQFTLGYKNNEFNFTKFISLLAFFIAILSLIVSVFTLKG